jgi:hypothetical protein
MTGYPTLTDIEVRWRAASDGLCIITEGETELDDPWFYQQWFGGDARHFTFFPQDGWEKVQDAVAVLRSTLGTKKVYGIIDRDFEPAVNYATVPADGILRTAKYTLENYLLDPGCWFNYIQMHARRVPKPGWMTIAETEATIANLYRRCLPLSAFNWTLRVARGLTAAAFKALPINDQTYREHPQALSNIDICAHFARLQAQLSLVENLPQMYTNRLRQLEAVAFGEWEQQVSGKYVLVQLRESFPIRPGDKKAWYDMQSAYLFNCPTPPTDLTNLLELIGQDAHS